MSARRRVLVMISSLLSCGLPGLAHENSLSSDSKKGSGLNKGIKVDQNVANEISAAPTAEEDKIKSGSYIASSDSNLDKETKVDQNVANEISAAPTAEEDKTKSGSYIASSDSNLGKGTKVDQSVANEITAAPTAERGERDFEVMSNSDIMKYLQEFKINEDVCKSKVCYNVDWGDSLRAIADNCLGDVGKVSSIIDLNFLQDDNIHPQQILYLPQPENKDWVLYNTETGDSYESISQKFYGTWQLWTVIKGYQEKYLASEGHLLSAGQLIKIPRYPFRLGYYVSNLDTWLTISVKTTGSIDNAEKIANINGCDVSKKPRSDSYLVIPETCKLS